MENLNAVITGVGGYVPDYVLTNDEISKMVDTNDEWIMGRIGIKERRILHEEGLGTSYMARKAVKQLMQRTKTSPNDIDLVIVATTTPDYHFPSTASILCDKLGLNNAFAFDMQAVCSGFLYAMEAGANFIRSGKYKKVVIVGADKMSSVIDYTDRATCPIFGDGAAAFMLEPTREDMGVMDAVLRTDGKGLPFLHIKAGGSVCAPSYYTLDNRMHYIYRKRLLNYILCIRFFIEVHSIVSASRFFHMPTYLRVVIECQSRFFPFFPAFSRNCPDYFLHTSGSSSFRSLSDLGAR